jgi:O-antigen biosynthesis protein
MTASGRALVCAPLLPEFDRESGSRRIHDLVQFLQDLGWSVSFVAQNAEKADRYVHRLQQAGVATYCGFGKETEALFASGQLDLAIFAFWYLAEQHAPALRRLSPRTRIIVESIDLHFVRNARRILQTSFGCEGGALDAAYGDEMVRELNAYSAADGVLTVSAKEAGLINDLTGDPTLACVVPDCEEFTASAVPFDERRGILFVGNFRHPPNVDAVGYLCKEVLPRVKPELLSEHPLYIVGNGLPDEVRRYAEGLNNVKIVGWVPTLVPYIERLRISVIPLLYGAGTKRKLLQSLMIGTPAVSTTIGAEGLGLADREQVLIADDPAAFAASIEELLCHRTLWESIARTGREWIMPRHGRQAARERMRAAIDLILKKAPKGTSGEERQIEK